MKLDYRNLAKSTIIVAILWMIITSITLFKLLTSKTIGEVGIACLMFITSILAGGYLILWWGNRPD